MKRLHSYLHVHRRKSFLNQRELAYLLGKKNASFISRFELQKRNPGLEAAFACQALFDILPAQLFPDLYSEIEADVVRRAYELDTRLKSLDDLRSRAKRKLLHAVLIRARDRIETIRT